MGRHWYYGTGPDPIPKAGRGADRKVPKRLRPFLIADARRRHPRGQSMVEFALTLPMLLILLLGVADFGRLFSQGIILEAAARNGAEAAALHTVALEAVCEEADPLPNRAASGTPQICSMPHAAVCVHDSAQGDAAVNGGNCGGEAAGAPAECTTMGNPAWTAAIEQTYPATQLPYVEVRVCYRFTTLFNLTNVNLPLGWSLSVGEFWLQRDRVFVAGAY
jgi:hypothetical protein